MRELDAVNGESEKEEPERINRNGKILLEHQSEEAVLKMTFLPFFLYKVQKCS